MTYESSPLFILGVVFVVDIGEEVMNIMELAIQVFEPCCAICMVCILCNVQMLKLVENHSFKLGICRSNVLKRLIDLNGHGLWIIFSLIYSTCVRFMIIGSNFNVCSLLSFNQSCVAYLGESHLVHIECGNMVQQANGLFKLSLHINTKMLNQLGDENHIWKLEIS